MQSLDNYGLISSERKWLHVLYHLFEYDCETSIQLTCICFRTAATSC